MPIDPDRTHNRAPAAYVRGMRAYAIGTEDDLEQSLGELLII